MPIRGGGQRGAEPVPENVRKLAGRLAGFPVPPSPRLDVVMGDAAASVAVKATALVPTISPTADFKNCRVGTLADLK